MWHSSGSGQRSLCKDYLTISVKAQRSSVFIDWKTVGFFSQNQFSVERSRVLQILTCNQQPANYTLRVLHIIRYVALSYVTHVIH